MSLIVNLGILAVF